MGKCSKRARGSSATTCRLRHIHIVHMSVNTPNNDTPSGQALSVADQDEFHILAPQSSSMQVHLFKTFGVYTAGLAFGLLLAWLVGFIYYFEGWLVDECSTSLLTQIQNNARKIGSEAAAVFEAEI